MKNTALISTAALAALSTVAFANDAAASTASKGKAGAPKAEDRVAPSFGEVRTDIAIPASAKRGTKSELAVKLEALAAPVDGKYSSIGLTNKTKKQISSQLSKINNADANQRQQIGVDGLPVVKAGEPIKDANGVVVSHGPSVPVMEKVKEFEAHDVDPKTDPDKATVRIFRIK